MNKQESLALFAKGRDAWNDWAEKMLNERAGLEAAGTWVESWFENDWNDETRAWHAAAAADFSEHTFEESAGFSDFVFPSGARFGGATFTGAAWFSKATFEGDAVFDGATFTGAAWFGGATFDRSANFRAIEAKSAFSLAGATFLAVPDFIQAQFAKAPRLDDSRIEPRRFWPTTLARVKDSVKGDPDLAARWRALKRLAIEGHDHASEQTFFRGELKARRWSEDKPRHAVFWFGVFYQVLSDFGRSIGLPIIWWFVSVLGFASLYLGQHPVLAKESWSGFGWAYLRLTSSSGDVPPLTCVAGAGEPLWPALILSAQKGLVFLGQVPINKLNQIHACLYGVHPVDAAQPSQLPASYSPVIPDGVTALGFLQYPLSAVLIFLFLLAIRNHFRIK